MNEQTILKIVTRACITLAVCVVAAIGGCTYVRHKAFAEGYEQQVTPGSNDTMWVKKGK